MRTCGCSSWGRTRACGWCRSRRRRGAGRTCWATTRPPGAQDLPGYGGLTYAGLYPGLDLQLTVQDGALTWRLAAQPGARLEQAALRITGAQGVTRSGGRLHLTTAAGALALPDLPGLTVLDAQDRPVAPEPAAAGLTALLTAAPANPEELLVSTFVGDSSSYDTARGVAVDGQGAMYVTGQACATDFPTTPGAFDTSLNGWDAYVSKFAPGGGALLYSTFVGGDKNDTGLHVAVDPNGLAYVAGETASRTGFPIVGGFQSVCNGCFQGGNDTVILKLNNSGNDLLYSTLLGGPGLDTPRGIALDRWQDEWGQIHYTRASTWPASPPLMPPSPPSPSRPTPTTRATAPAMVRPTAMWPPSTLPRIGDAAKRYITYFGGSGPEYLEGLAVDLNLDVDPLDPDWGLSEATVVGHSGSADLLATPGAVSTGQYSQGRAFVARFKHAGGEVDYIALLGGAADTNRGQGVALAADRRAYLTGLTSSQDFFATAQTGCGRSPGAATDGFLARLSPDATALEYGCFLGGSVADAGFAVQIGRDGGAYVAGATCSPNFPLTADAYQTTLPGGTTSCSLSNYSDLFLARFDAQGSLAYSSYLGGTQNEWLSGLALDAADTAYVVGRTKSTDFPTTGDAFAPGFHGGTQDGFLTRLALGRPPLPDAAVWSLCRAGDCRGGGLVAWSERTLGFAGDPINTRTGGLDYPVVDLALPALGGPLVFQRSYASPATGHYTATLGYGWTHNHATRLFLPGQPGGVAKQVRFQAHGASQYVFYELAPGVYRAASGLLAQLAAVAGGYQVTGPDQAVYRFDAAGGADRVDRPAGAQLELQL